MFDLTRVAVRNVGRNKRRTVIAIMTVFIGVVVSTATRGLLDGLQFEIRSGLTRKMHGDLQIHRQGYQDSLESNPYKLLIPDQIEGNPWQSAPRIRIMGMLNHQRSQTTTPVAITGVDSVAEAVVCERFAESVIEGSMIDSSREQAPNMVEDSDLGEAAGLDEAASATTTTQSPRAAGYQQLLVTSSLKRGLGAEIGDEFVVLIADKDNMQQAVVVTLVGVVDVALPGAAPRMAWMDLKTLQNTLNIGGRASEIAIRLPPQTHEQIAQKQLQTKIDSSFIVETWLELGGFLRDAMAIQNAVFSAIVAIVFVIVIASIVNTSMMTVMERTREIGTLMALGYQRVHILYMFLVESLVIGGAGGFAGAVVGTALIKILSVRGLRFALPGQSIPAQIYPNLSATFLLTIVTVSLVACLIAGFVPAFRASRLKPVDALSST